MSSQAATEIQGFWSGPPLSAVNWACLRSFVAAGHRFTLYSYDRLQVPAGVALRDAGEILPKSALFHFSNPVTGQSDIAPFADYFRLSLLAKKGGWYVDIDTVCLSSKLPSGKRIWARQAPEFEADSVSNGQLYFEANDPVALALLDRCEINRMKIERRESLGPMLISSVLKDLDLPKDMGATTEEFYPIRWIEIFKLWLPEFTQEVEERITGAIFLPVYQSFPFYIGLDNSKGAPQGSFLAKLVDKFAPEKRGPAHSADEVRRAVVRYFRDNGDWAINWLASIRGPEILAKLSLHLKSG